MVTSLLSTVIFELDSGDEHRVPKFNAIETENNAKGELIFNYIISHDDQVLYIREDFNQAWVRLIAMDPLVGGIRCAAEQAS